MRHFYLIIIALAIFTSCEDDPIVEPKQNGNSSGGSYARLSFPDSTQTKTSVNP